MPELTFAGHPLHPQLIAGPLGLMPFSLAMDVMYRNTKDPRYADAAYLAMVGGFVSGLAAGAAGTSDYLSIKQGTKTKRTAGLHGLLNVGALGLVSLSLLMRRKRTTKVGTLPFLLNVIANAGMTVSAWYGGDMVYTDGMRVKAAEDQPHPDVKLPNDEKIENAMRRLERQLTSV